MNVNVTLLRNIFSVFLENKLTKVKSLTVYKHCCQSNIRPYTESIYDYFIGKTHIVKVPNRPPTVTLVTFRVCQTITNIKQRLSRFKLRWWYLNKIGAQTPITGFRSHCRRISLLIFASSSHPAVGAKTWRLGADSLARVRSNMILAGP